MRATRGIVDPDFLDLKCRRALMAAVNPITTRSRVKWKSFELAGTHVFDGEFSWCAGLLAGKLFHARERRGFAHCAGPIALRKRVGANAGIKIG